jgi:hypothetical protein
VLLEAFLLWWQCQPGIGQLLQLEYWSLRHGPSFLHAPAHFEAVLQTWMTLRSPKAAIDMSSKMEQKCALLISLRCIHGFCAPVSHAAYEVQHYLHTDMQYIIVCECSLTYGVVDFLVVADAKGRWCNRA